MYRKPQHVVQESPQPPGHRRDSQPVHEFELWISDPAAPPAADLLAGGPNELLPVWPDASGTVRGLALEPVHGSVVEPPTRDPGLGEQLALVDALRIGDALIRGRTADQLPSRLSADVT